MSHFYGKLKDNGRGSVTTKTGSKKHGMSTQLNGYNIGTDVQIIYDELTQTDIITCMVNLGSNGGSTQYKMKAYRIGEEVIVECES